MNVRRRREWWRQTVAELAESDLGPAEFAARKAVKEATLRWWMNELRRSPAPESSARGFVEMVATTGGRVAADAGSAVPIDVTARPVGVAIRVGGGVTVVLESLPAPEYVARLAAAYDAQRS